VQLRASLRNAPSQWLGCGNNFDQGGAGCSFPMRRDKLSNAVTPLVLTHETAVLRALHGSVRSVTLIRWTGHDVGPAAVGTIII
jgi:hypothetical protein